MFWPPNSIFFWKQNHCNRTVTFRDNPNLGVVAGGSVLMGGSTFVSGVGAGVGVGVDLGVPSLP
jgi:hypothetical protein